VSVVVAFLMLCLFFWWQKPDVFLNSANLAVIMRFVATFGLLAIGEVLVIITGGIDLSVGSMTALTGVLAAVLMLKGIGLIPPMDIVPAIIIVLICAALVGIWHGFFVTKLHIPPFIITLGTWLIARGLSIHYPWLSNCLSLGLSLPGPGSGYFLLDPDHVHHPGRGSANRRPHFELDYAGPPYLCRRGQHRGGASVRHQRGPSASLLLQQ
jgi:ribose transport system permease protein